MRRIRQYIFVLLSQQSWGVDEISFGTAFGNGMLAILGILFINKLSIRKADVLDVQNDSQLYESTKLNLIAPEKSCNFSEAIKKVYAKSLKAVPFILFTFTINCILDTFYNALWIGLKLFIVCNITIIYSETTSIIRFSRYNKNNVFST